MQNKFKKRPITFIDLFAGIGGFHLALSQLGAECVFVNEFDGQARKTYENYFREKEPELFSDESREPYFWKSIKDITFSNSDIPKEVWKKNIKKIIPRFDILCAGFPCQPFSGIGKRRGFDDDRGTLFSDIVRIIEARQPRVVFLENVRNIVAHDGKRTFEFILDSLDKAGYYVNRERDDSWNIFKASEFGLPTARSRFYLVAFRKGTRGANGSFKFPKPITPEGMTLRKFFKDEKWPDRVGRTIRVGGRASPVRKEADGSWFIDKRSWDTYIWDAEYIKGKFFGGKEHVLTIEEAKKMMGFPKDFDFPSTVSPNQSFKQLGNSVAVDAVREIAKEIMKLL